MSMDKRLNLRFFGVVLTFATILIFPSAAVAAEGASLLWVQDGRLTRQAEQVVGAIRRAEDFGLSSRDFKSLLTTIDAHAADDSPELLDDLVTAAASRFVRQIHFGRVLPGTAGYALTRRRAPLDVPETLREVSWALNPLAVLERLEPRSGQYRSLKQALARYRRLPAEIASLPALPRRRIDEGDLYIGSAKLRELLVAFGDSPDQASSSEPENIYGASLAAAVVRFQRRHGLTPDGVLGARTFAALTTPLQRRIRQLELTMERWRWMPDIAPPAVIVNVPQFMLYALQRPGSPAEGEGPLRIPVIVGESAKQTPIFDSTIESVIFRPYWNVPTSIVRAEVLPLIRRDPGYLARHNMEIVRGQGDDAMVLPANEVALAALRSGKARLRQRPGPENALGLIKFVLPNPYSVYLHSTPETRLFERERRALSHGCIRVSDASALAAYLLADTEGNWDVAAIEAATCGSETFTVRLAFPVPIFILYGTVVVDTNGEVLFFEDIYGYDERLDELLRHRS